MRNNIILVGILTMASLIVYFIQFIIFHRVGETIFYMFQDLAFIPIQVAIVTIVLNRFLNVMEKRKKIKKVNVIISAFFMEVGTEIIIALSEFNRSQNEICEAMNIKDIGRNKKIIVKKLVSELKYDIYAEPEKLEGLAVVMVKNKAYMLRMLENSNLLEHDSFTDMLWAVFHVADELQSRGDFKDITQMDVEHLSKDFLRAYTAIVLEWINYIIYLHDEYPFLYALEIRKNPFCR